MVGGPFHMHTDGPTYSLTDYMSMIEHRQKPNILPSFLILRYKLLYSSYRGHLYQVSSLNSWHLYHNCECIRGLVVAQVMGQLFWVAYHQKMFHSSSSHHRHIRVVMDYVREHQLRPIGHLN
jgi:hypothetical protein